MLSGDELLTLAEENTKQRITHARDLVFGLLDISAAMLLFLPFFGKRSEGLAQGVSLLALTETPPYLRITYYTLVVGMILWGVLTLGLQNCSRKIWVRSKTKLSLLLNGLGTVVFVVSLQPYGAVFLLMLLAIKVCMLIKWQ